MKQKLLALAVVAPLAAGISAVLLAGLGGWFLVRGSTDRSAAIHIALAPALSALPAPTTAENAPVGVLPAVPGSSDTSAVASLVDGEPAVSASNPAVSVIPAAAQTRLVIPSLSLDVPVVVAPMAGDSWQVDHLQQTVGHLAGTALPGDAGNTVIAGHVSLADGSAGPFARLAQLSPSDEVWLVQGQATFKYIVATQQMVDPAAIQVTYPSQTGQITLITCGNWQPITGSYASRLVVTGHLVTG